MRTMFVVIGPSGAGKSSVLSDALKQRPDIKLAVSHTTRAMRTDDVEGKHYHFVSTCRFLWMLVRGQFIEWAQNPPRSTAGKLYGTSRQALRDVRGHLVLEIDLQGARKIRKLFPDARIILVRAPLEMLKERIAARNDSMPIKELDARLKRARIELEEGAVIADHIINNDGPFERSVAQLVAIFDTYAPRT